jgi:hypothetical protein
MFLIAHGTKALARWDGAEREKRCERQIRKIISLTKFSREVHNDEGNATIQYSPCDLHRQVDTKGFVLAARKALSTRAVAPPAQGHLPADAYPNSSQSGVHWINRQARDGIEDCCGRIFLDPAGQNNNRTAQRHVPVGATTTQEGES